MVFLHLPSVNLDAEITSEKGRRSTPVDGFNQLEPCFIRAPVIESTAADYQRRFSITLV